MTKHEDELSPLSPAEEATMRRWIEEEIAPYVAAGAPAALLAVMREQAEQAFRTHPEGRALLAASVPAAAPDRSGDVRRDGLPDGEEQGGGAS